MTVTILNNITDKQTKISNVSMVKTLIVPATVFIEMNDEEATTYYYNNCCILAVDLYE